MIQSKKTSASPILSFLLAAYVVAAKYWKTQLIWKLLVFLALLVASSFAVQVMQQSLSEFSPSNYFVSWFSKFGAFCLVVAYFHFCKRKTPKYLWAIIFSCGLSNLLSHFYPPFRVVDYLYIDVLHKYLRSGIMNLADLIFDIGFASIIVYILTLPIRTLLLRRRRRRHS